jgi:hypothetical protein
MNLNPDPAETASLEALAYQAQDYALHMMRTTGSVPPTVIADTKDGFIFCMPTGMPDEAAKDQFADVARLLAVAHAARAIVMVVEAWVRLAKPGGHLDTQTPPSQSPDRQEMVALILEDHSRSGTCLLPIMRDDFGKFVEFGDNTAPNFTSTTGRFSGLMPKQTHSAQEVTAAMATLNAMGMLVVNRGFDPSMN